MTLRANSKRLVSCAVAETLCVLFCRSGREEQGRVVEAAVVEGGGAKMATAIPALEWDATNLKTRRAPPTAQVHAGQLRILQ